MPRTAMQRLIAPQTIALIGAGAWTDAVAAGAKAVGFEGSVWRVHPTRPSTALTTYFRSVAELPGAPDAAFIAVPNHDVPAVAAALGARGAGGFVCFSAGFSEVGSEAGSRLTEELCTGAGAQPFFGPNCYGFVNFFDRAALWPDQVVGGPLDRGVALICQSGTIALTLMFNARSVPIGYLFTVGNQTRLAVEDLIELLCDDPRVSAFGLYLEGIKDTERFAAAAAKAQRARKPIAVVKSGRTAAAARTAHSHTGALAGADEVFEAFCRQAGLARCDTLATLCETLKLLHARGPLAGSRVLVMGASGGDMAMTADVARSLPLDFAAIPPQPAAALRELMSDRVTIANPFDLHTYLWFDPPALRKVFGAVLHAGYDAVGFMLDCPPEPGSDTSAFDAVIDVYIEAAATAPTPAALIASLPETLSARTRRLCLDGGVVPLQGQREALEALGLAGGIGRAWREADAPRLQRPRPSTGGAVFTLDESAGKALLADAGVPIARGAVAPAARAVVTAAEVGYPVVMKALGAHLEHKTEVGGVVLNIRDAAGAAAAAARLAPLSDTLLIEQMVGDAVAEILVGVIVDPQFGQVLVIGAGGVLTELLQDSVTLLPPWTPQAVRAALAQLRVAPLLSGHRGKPAGDLDALVNAIVRVGVFATAHLHSLVELDVNPIMVRPPGMGVVAVDALIRLQQE